MEIVVEKFCPFSHRCILVLLEKKLPFEIKEIDLVDKGNFEEILSPYGRVPVLRDGAKSIYESSIINEYLEDICPSPRLLPEAAERRAMARFWIDFCNTRFMPAYFELLKERDPGARRRRKAKLLDHLETIESLGLAAFDGAYWMGSEATLVDFAFYPFFERFSSVEVYRGVAIPERLERLAGWLAAMRERHSVAEVFRPRQEYVEYFAGIYAD